MSGTQRRFTPWIISAMYLHSTNQCCFYSVPRVFRGLTARVMNTEMYLKYLLVAKEQQQLTVEGNCHVCGQIINIAPWTCPV